MADKVKYDQHKHRNNPAQSLVEVAFLLPVLLLLILAAMDIGRMFYTKIVLTNAAREGVNYLSRHSNDTDKVPRTFESIYNEGLSSGVEILMTDVDWANTDCCTPGQPVTIAITKSVDLIFDGILQSLGLINGPVVMTSSVKMVVQ